MTIGSRISASHDPAALEARGVAVYSALNSRMRQLVGRKTADQLAPMEPRQLVSQIGESNARGAEIPTVARAQFTRKSRQAARRRQLNVRNRDWEKLTNGQAEET